MFLAQTKSQMQLLEKHFGDTITCYVVGMSPFDLEVAGTEGLTSVSTTPEFDIVYHGSTHPAKGVLFS